LLLAFLGYSSPVPVERTIYSQGWELKERLTFIIFKYKGDVLSGAERIPSISLSMV
jgi:hypothetical protein